MPNLIDDGLPQLVMVPTNLRYLTGREKERCLRHQVRDGDLPEGMQAYLDRLNDIVGVCVTRYDVGGIDEGEGLYRSGRFVLRLAEHQAMRFYQAMEDFKCKVPMVEDVVVSWRPGYQTHIVLCAPAAAGIVADALQKLFEFGVRPR